MGDQERKGEWGVPDKGNLEAWSPQVGRSGETWGRQARGPMRPFSAHPLTVVISRQRRRVQLMRIRQQEERKEKRRKKRPPRAPPRGPRAPPRPGPPDPAYRRRPVPIKRFNGDVLSPVSTLSLSSPHGGEGSAADSAGRRGPSSPGGSPHSRRPSICPPVVTPAPGACRLGSWRERKGVLSMNINEVR